MHTTPFYSLTWHRKDGTGHTGAQCYASSPDMALMKLKAICLDSKYFPLSKAGSWVLSVDNEYGQFIPVSFSK